MIKVSAMNGVINIHHVSRLFMATGEYVRRLHLQCHNETEIVDMLLSREQTEDLIRKLKAELDKEL